MILNKQTTSCITLYLFVTLLLGHVVVGYDIFDTSVDFVWTYTVMQMQINTVKFIGEFGGYRKSNHYFTKSSMDNDEELQGGGEYVSLPKEMSASSIEELMLFHCFRIRRIWKRKTFLTEFNPYEKNSSKINSEKPSCASSGLIKTLCYFSYPVFILFFFFSLKWLKSNANPKSTWGFNKT